MSERAVIDVGYLGSVDDPVVAPLERNSGALSVERVNEHTADVDCLVVGVSDDGELSTLEQVASGSPPAIAFVAPEPGLGERATETSATAVVTAAGPDRLAVLADRVETIVERHRTVADLHETEARFDALVENTSFGTLTVDSNSVIQYASPAIEEVFGYEPPELVGESLTKLMPDRFRDPHREGVARYLETNERQLDWGWIEIPGQRADGAEIPLGVSFGERDADGEHLFSAVIRDISDQREQQERLDEMASAIEGSMDGIALLDEDGQFQYVNDAHLDIYGYEDRSALIGNHWDCLYDESEAERFRETIMPTVASEGQWRGEATGETATEESFPQELSLTELDDGGLVCVVRDVSERVEQRRQLESEREFVETVINTLPDLFYVVDTDGTFSRWNDRMESVTGYSADELDGMDALSVIAPEDHEVVSDAIANVIESGITEGVSASLSTKQGKQIPYELSGNRLTDADGEPVGLAGMGRDVSGRQLRQQRLRVLSRVLRHNVRNRTTVIRGQAEHVREHTAETALTESLSRIESAASDLATASERARQAEQVLRNGINHRDTIDMVALVTRPLAAAETDGLRVETDLPDEAWIVGTATIEEAVLELVANARSHVTDPTIRISVERLDETVKLVIADDGPGLPEHERRALAEGDGDPLSHSTGLGLWLVRWAITAAGGQVTVRDDTLGGTAIVLSFPQAHPTTR